MVQLLSMHNHAALPLTMSREQGRGTGRNKGKPGALVCCSWSICTFPFIKMLTIQHCFLQSAESRAEALLGNRESWGGGGGGKGESYLLQLEYLLLSLSKGRLTLLHLGIQVRLAQLSSSQLSRQVLQPTDNPSQKMATTTFVMRILKWPYRMTLLHRFT